MADARKIPEDLRVFDASQGPRKLRADEGEYYDLGSIASRIMIWGEETGGNFSLNEHPLAPGALAAPLHIHEDVDEYCYVLEGRIGVMLDDDVIYCEAGELSFRPKNQWHTFWNAGDTPVRMLELMSPGGFEHFFREWHDGLQTGTLDMEELGKKYKCESDFSSIARICTEYGLTHPAFEG